MNVELTNLYQNPEVVIVRTGRKFVRCIYIPCAIFLEPIPVSNFQKVIEDE